MPMYSYSRISAFETCPLKYKYSYIDRLDRIQTIEAFMGNRVHETLKKLYENQMNSKRNELDDLIQYYEKIWNENYSDEIKIVKSDYTADNYLETGRKCIVDYYNKYAPFDQTKTIGLERQVSFEIEDYRMKGFIDRIGFREDGTYEIHDYKTSRYLPSQEEIENDKQLGLYQIGIAELWPDADDVELIWHFLAHDRELKSRKSPSDLAILKEYIVGMIGKIERAEEQDDFPSRESPLCPWCDFQSLCPSHKHIIAMNGMTSEAFLSDDGVELVNQYAERKVILDTLEKEIEELKNALIAYSKKETVEVIRGSDKKVRVKQLSRQKFPGKKDADRPELEELIRKAEKWNDVSTLDTNALAKAIDSSDWGADLIEKVKRYLSLEESYRVTLSVMRDNDE